MAIKMPGTIPAISSAAIGCSARLASRTASADGGISMAIPPVAMIGPMANFGAYPRSTIWGSRTLPSRAVLAIVDPDSVENRVPPNIVTIDSRPGTRAISRSTAAIAFSATPL